MTSQRTEGMREGVVVDDMVSRSVRPDTDGAEQWTVEGF